MENTALGQATRVKQTAKGAEMLIVCRSRDVKTIDNGESAFTGGDLQKRASSLEKKYLAELTKKAVVKQR